MGETVVFEAWMLRYRDNLLKAAVRAKTNVNTDATTFEIKLPDLDEMRRPEKEILKYVQGRSLKVETPSGVGSTQL